jgi:hypothetical protein
VHDLAKDLGEVRPIELLNQWQFLYPIPGMETQNLEHQSLSSNHRLTFPRGYKMNALKDKVINIEFRENHYRLSRLNDSQYYELWKNSLAIADDYRFYIDFYLYLRQQGEELNLAQLYVTLEQICGKSNQFFDDWKGSFSFPFFLEISKAGQTFDYLLEIYDHRGSLYWDLLILCFRLW